MSLADLSSGNNLPNEFNTVIEISMNSDPVKYEVDKNTGLVFVDRFMSTAMVYPCNYGYIPKTLAGDGDPVDVLLVSPYPLPPGCVIESRAVGMLKMKDEAGEDAKVLAVPVKSVSTYYDNVASYKDFPLIFLEQIEHFFTHYKDLEKGKFVEVSGWTGLEEAYQEISSGAERY